MPFYSPIIPFTKTMKSSMSRHAACKLPVAVDTKTMKSSMSRHAACKLPVAVDNRLDRRAANKVCRHVTFKLPSAIDDRPERLPVSIKQDSSANGIIVEVRKVKADVSELQKNLALETAARNELHMCVEQLKVDTTEMKQSMTQAANDVRNPNNATKTLHLLMKTLPCKSLDELDSLLAFIGNRSLQWTEYIKLLGGSDFNSAIKTIINAVMQRSVQKQLSWTGLNTKKPSLKFKYKSILDGIHLAMKERFEDYTIVQGEATMQNLLRNAARKN